MNNQLLLDNLRCIPDWPIKGVNFRDVTTLFKNPASLKEISDEMYELYKDKGITKIVGIESRGFVMSSALAIRLGAGVVLCRKPGKLPCKTVQESYAKEYGMDTIEIHEDAINENDVVLLHDDLLATGGTMKAACDQEHTLYKDERSLIIHCHPRLTRGISLSGCQKLAQANQFLND